MDLAPWLEQCRANQDKIRAKAGWATMAVWSAAGAGLSAFRRLMRPLPPPPPEQLPWLPQWPGLTSRPSHDSADFPWVADLQRAFPEILAEMRQVRGDFARAVYDADANPLPWFTYFFYLQGRPVEEHLRACPRTAEILSRLPVNGFHVCFSAIGPGGTLIPHTGPCNAGLTAHLGLQNCDGATMYVADRELPYRDGEVFLFDDSYLHWVEHKGQGERVTLMITFWHPDLNALERRFISEAFRRSAA